MLRGLVHSYKEVVHYNYDTNMTKDFLDEVIITMERNGFRVWGTGFDLGNKTFLKQIRFKDGVFSFDNPYECLMECGHTHIEGREHRQVYLFPDAGMD